MVGEEADLMASVFGVWGGEFSKLNEEIASEKEKR